MFVDNKYGKAGSAMSLQRKLGISFCVFLVVLLSAMASILFVYGSAEMERSAQENLNVIGNKMAGQFDNLVHPMNFITVNLIATDNFISSMSALANIPRGIPQNDRYINEAMRHVYVTLCNDSINRNFYSINVFNEQGDLFSSRTQQANIRVPADEIQERFQWTLQANELYGKILLIPPHIDLWNETQQVHVFSLVRALQGDIGRVGYIEVQVLSSELDKIFSVPDSVGVKAILLAKDKTIFYQNGFSSSEEAADFMRSHKNKEYISMSQPADFTQFTLFLFQNKQDMLKPLTNIMRFLGIMLVALLTVSCMFAFALNRQLVKPVRDLRRQMEGIELETLQDTLPHVASGNDLVALEKTFSQLRARLSEAVTRTLRSQALQMQANYDALQMQINPHFLYNVLNVISHKGMEIGDDAICEICSDLASMLRYSTSTRQRVATIGEELTHVKAYLSLMQKRYEKRIHFQIHTQDDVLSCEIPKIVLQQFVENSINHSFAAGYKNISIHIFCTRNENGWKIRVLDNGPGFSAAIKEKLLDDMLQLRHNLLNQNAEFAIGGMGLLNTYARLWLFFGDTIHLKLDNAPQGGADIVIELCPKGRVK